VVWGALIREGFCGSDGFKPRARYRLLALQIQAQGEEKLQFEVNGEDYFLNFAEDERRWFVFVPSPTGLQRIPVYIDVSKYERIGLIDEDRPKRPN